MKYLLAFVACVLIATTFSVRAQSPDDQYVRIYTLIQQADALNDADQSLQALTKYLDAQSSLEQLQKVYPEWNSKVVNFRLNYLAAKIALLTNKASTSPAAESETNSAINAESTPTTPIAPTTDDSGKKVADLEGEVRQLQADKQLLEAKLKEALATQPAAIDARELAKAQEQIQSLMKENDLLKVSIVKQQGQASPAVDNAKALEETKQALTEASRKLSDETAKVSALTSEKEALQKQLDNLSSDSVSAAQFDAVKRSLDEANAKLATQINQAEKLKGENSELRSQLDKLTASSEAADALRAENELLKNQLTKLKSSEAISGVDSDQKKQLEEAQARIATLQSDADVLRLEKAGLEDRIKAAASLADTNARRVKELEDERASLQQKLAKNQRGGFFRRRGSASDAKTKELSQQVESLQTKLQVLEAQTVPYTPEEQALFQKSETQLASADTTSAENSFSGLSASAATLATEAQRLFSKKQYDQAEEKYLEILRQGQGNTYTLANLAAIQLEMGKLDDAEKNLKQALATSPNDAYSLSILGYLKFRQEKYDEALDALSRASQLQPKNAEVLNYLGVTLSHKGMRGPAESALRRAIQIDPNYGSAHNNLAVIYATQQPPLLGLARWHYQKALAAGHPRNEDLEKLLDQKSTNAPSVTP